MRTGKRRASRLLSLILALAMCLSVLPVTAAAEDESTTYTWTKVTSAPDDWSGEYLLVYEADSTTAYVFDGTTSANDYVEASISSSTITADKTNAVTLETVDGGYVLKNASGSYLYQSADSNGIATSANQSTAANYPLTVSVTEDGVDLELSSGPHMRFNVASDQMRFRYYKSSTYTNQQAVTLYALSGESSGGGTTTEDVETPSLTYSETDKTVTFKCATSGVTYYYSYSESGDYTALDGDSLDVSDHIGETLYAYAELDGSKSDINSVELTETSTGGDETDENVSTIAEVKADADTSITYTVDGTVTYISGKSVYVQDETGGICLYFSTAPSDISLGDDVRASGTYTTYKGLVELTGVTDYTIIGSTSELPSQTVTIAELNSDYSDSKALQSTRVYLTGLTVGTVGTSTTLTDADGNSIVAYQASSVLTEAGATEGSVISLYAVVSDYNGYQLYVAQASDITVTSTGSSEEDDDTDTGLTSGSYVIWAPAYNMALSSTYSGYYNAGVSVTQAEDGTLSGYSSTEVWTVTVGEDGTITIAYGDQNLGMAASYSSMTLGAVNDQWTLEDAGDGLYYVKNTGRDCYIEWYASNEYWSGYAYINEGSEGMFALRFTPVEDTGD
ncbi:MAG: hypothetical protein LIO51_04790, partial [Clostridiales bacterium]|nr:hypothetical protein [Clostridiales bacterium]